MPLELLDALPREFSPGSMYIVRASIDRLPLPVDVLASRLTEDERARARRFRQEDDATRHLLGRGLARLALARAMACAPEELAIQLSEKGKPYLDEGPSFSISHSGNEVVVALGDGGRIGIDVEAIRPIRDLMKLARSSFTEDEVLHLQEFPLEQRQRAFFRVWVRKEAMLKALGSGLSGLSHVSVWAREGSDNMLRRLDSEVGRIDQWKVVSFAVDPAVEAAVAWDRPMDRLVRLDL